MKRLVFCFDGTWNKIDTPNPTNVLLTAESVLPFDTKGASKAAQLIYYHQGVGTAKWDRVRGGLFGLGLLENLADAYRFLIFNYTPGDEIYLFGFSRGAYSARSFVGLLRHCGIPLRRNLARVQDAIKTYQARSDCPTDSNEMMGFRWLLSPDVCVSEVEEEWRVGHIDGYEVDPNRRLSVTYLGVWDTVGALGVPNDIPFSKFFNRKNEFHDTCLTPFVKSARHAVAIDERRSAFSPTLWANISELNAGAGKPDDDPNAPYREMWFPGTHSSVGGGGERRGLSDQALHWVLGGARLMGLALDSGTHSRIYEFAPDHREFIENSAKLGIIYRVMKRHRPADRRPGPKGIHEVSWSAQCRWHDLPQNLQDKCGYRPPTLDGVSAKLNTIDPSTFGVGAQMEELYKNLVVDEYLVKPGDSMRKIAKRFLGDANLCDQIFAVNRDRVEDPDEIFAGRKLRIPRPELS